MEQLKELKNYFGSDWWKNSRGGWMTKKTFGDKQVKYWKGGYNPTKIKKPNRILGYEIDRGKFSMTFPYRLISQIDGMTVECRHDMHAYCHYKTSLIFENKYFFVVDSSEAAEEKCYFEESRYYLATKIKLKIAKEHEWLYIRFDEIVEKREISQD